MLIWSKLFSKGFGNDERVCTADTDASTLFVTSCGVFHTKYCLRKKRDRWKNYDELVLHDDLCNFDNVRTLDVTITHD